MSTMSISDKDKASLDSLKERAFRRIYSVTDLKAIIAGDMPPPGDYKEFREELDCGIRLVFTYETQKDGFLYRHVSIDVYNKDKYLNTFGEPFVFCHFKASILSQTVYALGINPAGVYPMLCWGESGKKSIPGVNFLQRVSAWEKSDRKEVGSLNG